MAKTNGADPIAGLSFVERVLWRRRGRRVVEDVRREQAASLDLIRGRRLLGAIVEERGTLMAALEGCWLTIRGVTEETRRALLEISRHSCHIDGVGRYRGAWWIAVLSDGAELASLRKVVVLASHLAVSEDA